MKILKKETSIHTPHYLHTVQNQSQVFCSYKATALKYVSSTNTYQYLIDQQFCILL